MAIFKIVGIAIIAVTLVMVVRSYKPEMAIQVSIAAGITLLIVVVGEITGFVDTVKNAAASYGLNSDYIMLIFKVVGIAYIIQLAAQICTDAGESAIASKVELAGRVMILLAAAPTAFSILDMILELVP